MTTYNKQRLEAIIDAIQTVEPSTARILKMLEDMRDDWKEPHMVIECGYIDINDMPSKEDMGQYQSSAMESITENSYQYKEKGSDEYKVTLILEKEDE